MSWAKYLFAAKSQSLSILNFKLMISYFYRIRENVQNRLTQMILNCDINFVFEYIKKHFKHRIL